MGSSFPFSSLTGEYVEEAFVKAAKELEGKYVLVPTKKFLQFLPDPPEKMPTVDEASFKKVPSDSELKMYEPLISALAPFLKTGWSLVNTSNAVDPNSGFFMEHCIKPDITVYSNEGEPSNDNLCRAADMESFLEVKPHHFHEPFGNKADELEKTSGYARDTRGQLATYLNAMKAAQYRTHSFGVIIVGSTCRLLRHTQSGTERGLDTTYQPVGENLETRARSLLNAQGKKLYKVSVDDQSFFVAAPFTRSHHYPVGRGTRCFIAVDCQTYQKCLLKDTWRLDVYHQESETYRKLHQHQVPNIANVLAAGDVPGQRCGYPSPDWIVPLNATFRRHIHYRIVLDVVGKPINRFESTHALVGYIRDAFEAHYMAHTKAKIEHRDVSVANLVIGEKDGVSRGLLIDWELARYQEDATPRTYEQIGTRQFMATRLFQDPPPVRTIGDDIESFVLVLLWLAVRYTPNDMLPKARESSFCGTQASHHDGSIPSLSLPCRGPVPVAVYRLTVLWNRSE
ncbi:hypothetical protein B0H14DRAFT_2699614 [Mycena olivaceomarginata]|nr:hypothetical protein B0H14DRAFT_2699614 [Mycena olivaceomarginata]